MKNKIGTVSGLLVLFLLLVISDVSAGSWHNLSAGVNGNVVSLLYLNGSVYVGGHFHHANCGSRDGDCGEGSVDAYHIARWDGSEWHGVPDGSGTDNGVHAMVSWKNELYVGGEFTSINVPDFENPGDPAYSIAKWNGSNWTAVGNGMEYGTSVYALVADNNYIYAGGSFTTSDGLATNYISRWNGTAWENMSSGMNGAVRALTIWNDTICAGGEFTTAGGLTTNNVACWNSVASSWYNLSNGVYSSTGGSIFSLTEWNGSLCVGGWTDSFGNSITCWDGAAWYNLSVGFTDLAAVRALSSWNSLLYAGGDFTVSGETPLNYSAKWDGREWTSVEAGLGNSVLSITTDASYLYAGGQFVTTGSGVTVNHIALYGDTTTTTTSTTTTTEGTSSTTTSLASWTPDYVAGDLGKALVNLFVVVIIVFTGKTPDLVDLATVGIMIGILGFILPSLVGIATLAFVISIRQRGVWRRK
jgi:hypothetical protein